MAITRLPEHELKFLGRAPVVYHCHHFNLFLDQTIDDALGDDGPVLRRLAARQASAELLNGLIADAPTPLERLEVAKQTFSAMGHGKLIMNVDASGGEARSRYLHYGVSWVEKYGEQVRRHEPADAFAGGFASAATAVAYGKPGESLDAKEVECVAMRQEKCRFEIAPGESLLPVSVPVDQGAVGPFLTAPQPGVREEEICKITDGLNAFLAGVQPDERGLIEAFGVFVTLHPANYYNRVSFDALDAISQRASELVAPLGDLLRESGHVCVFNTFGGILSSPEWEGLVGAPEDNPEQIAAWCLAIARALGFGRWSLSAFEAGKRMVVTTPVNYEVPYYRLRHGGAASAPEFFFQGAAAAIMQLAHGVKWSQRPKLTQVDYLRLFVDDELPWRLNQPESAALGAQRSVVEVTSR